MDLKRLINSAIQIQQIPSPTFSEADRSNYMLGQFESIGLADVSSDDLGNVFGRFPGSGAGQVVVSAHLDTVFPTGTILDIQREGSLLIGPGIGDNAIALAMMLELAITLTQQQARSGSAWFVANVREEGLGNLEGMRRVVERFADTVDAYIVLEGMGLGHIYHRALRVQRYRIAVETAGGHAWIHAGRESAIHTLIRIGARIMHIPRPPSAQFSVNIGVVDGGTSINTIASRAYFDLDLRAEDGAVLEQFEQEMQTICDRHRTMENRVSCEDIGSRPGGELARDHELVRLACEAMEAGDVTECLLGIASTDANIPLSVGLPAVCVGLTQGGNAHTSEEFIDTATIPNGFRMLTHLVEGALRLGSS